ncbi:MAG: glutamine amidotransferase [Pseudomonadota bacterium]
MLDVDQDALSVAGEAAKDAGEAAAKRPVLLILHQKHSTPGHIGNVLRAQGHVLDIRRPRFGDPLPATLSGHDGAVIFGGPMSANDPDDYIKREIDWINVALEERAPFLGVCLGGQMLAKTLGGDVSLNAAAHVEIGYHDIAPHAQVFDEGDWPERVYQWHNEGFSVPDGAEPLARGGNAFPNQAFRVGPTAVGIQFHPEITYAMVARWSGHNPEKLLQAGAQERSAQMRDHIANAPKVLGWLDRFLSAWVAEGRRVRSD